LPVFSALVLHFFYGPWSIFQLLNLRRFTSFSVYSVFHISDPRFVGSDLLSGIFIPSGFSFLNLFRFLIQFYAYGFCPGFSTI